MRLIWVLLCLGCGRLGFDLVPGIGGDVDSDGDGIPDILEGEPGEVRLHTNAPIRDFFGE